jgi:chaperone modulatory protein CbpM
MITVAAVLARVPGLDSDQLHDWIAQEWVRPARSGGELLFADIDVARLHLILDLQEMEVGEGAVHETGRHMRRLIETLDPTAVEEVMRRLRS